MSVQHGMDSGRVRQIAGQLRGEVQALTNVLGEGNASAERLREHWLGDDGQELVVRWTSDAAKQIGAATETLRALATGLERQAEDQDEASGTGDGRVARHRHGRRRCRQGRPAAHLRPPERLRHLRA